MWRWMIVALTVVLVACGSGSSIHIGEVTLVDVEYPTADENDVPQYVTLAAEVENSGGAIRLKECRFWLYYNNRKVAMVELERGVKIPRRSQSSVELRLHVAVARNSQTLPLRRALQTGELSNVQMSWEAKVGKGLLSKRIEQTAEQIEAVLTEETIAEIMKIVKE